MKRLAKEAVRGTYVRCAKLEAGLLQLAASDIKLAGSTRFSGVAPLDSCAWKWELGATPHRPPHDITGTPRRGMRDRSQASSS